MPMTVLRRVLELLVMPTLRAPLFDDVDVASSLVLRIQRNQVPAAMNRAVSLAISVVIVMLTH